ncbi:hypothetical protein ACFPRA_20470 [Sporosarcina soli]|uniref:Restriction endonuclease type IV Mrr domain-containing protein n=1 Tax=Sporosarcina soli TaxID=334736 RepID=A0ABW0TR22_9BACL
MTNTLRIPNIGPLEVREYFDNFIGETIKIYSQQDEEVGKGRLSIDFHAFNMGLYTQSGDPKLSLTIKELDMKALDDNYKLLSIITLDSNYYKLEVNMIDLKSSDGRLKGNAELNNIIISLTTLEDYEEFRIYTQSINWEEIKLPGEFAGKDKVDEAGAFEALCLDIINEWGGQNLEIIGKGADRARDGCFNIAAYSWIPIITDYSNKWVLQCKYSKGYENLQISEIYDEITKVLMHKPDYFLLMTNRKITSDFLDWFNTLKDTKYHIPFKCILINKTQIEQVLAEPKMSHIKRKYFG